MAEKKQWNIRVEDQLIDRLNTLAPKAGYASGNEFAAEALDTWAETLADLMIKLREIEQNSVKLQRKQLLANIRQYHESGTERRQKMVALIAASASEARTSIIPAHRLRVNRIPQHLSARKPLSHAAMMGASSASVGAIAVGYVGDVTTFYSILRNEYATSAMRIGIVLSVGSSFRNIFKTLPPSDSCQVSVILSPILGGLSEPTIASESWITCLSGSHLNL